MVEAYGLRIIPMQRELHLRLVCQQLNRSFLDEHATWLQQPSNIFKHRLYLLPIPAVTFTKNYTLQVGNQTLQLAYYGNNHFPGNIFIYAPKQKVLMLVDIIFPGWAPFPYLAVAKDVAGFIKAHDIVG